MQYLEFKSPRGVQVTIGEEDGPFHLISFEGYGGVDTGLQTTRSPYQHGETFLGHQLESRDMVIEFMIMRDNRTQIAEERSMLSRVFNPADGIGELVSHYGDSERSIYCTVDVMPQFPDGSQNQGESFQRCVVELRALNPFWVDATDRKISLAAYSQSLTLPFTMPTLMGVEGQSKVVDNEGHVRTPLEITFNGPSENPVITNETTGEFIKVYRTLASTDRLTINTAFNEKRVEIESGGKITNAYGYVDWFESSFIQLEPGENVISYKADSGTEDADIELVYRHRYLGV